MNNLDDHVQMYRRLLESISYYSNKALDLLQSESGDLPQWANDIISATRTHIKDVTHFLRGQGRRGIRYGGLEAHGRAYMATKNLSEILEYANESLSHLTGHGLIPAWAENKISICAEYMDLIGHWLENELAEGRRYGSSRELFAASDALYLGRAHGISGVPRNLYSPNDFRHNIYEQGFREAYRQSGIDIPTQRTLEPHSQNTDQIGRRFGVPGYTPGTPGWAGQAGVAQAPRPSRVSARLRGVK